MERLRAAAAAGFEGVGPGGRAGGAVRLLRPRAARLPDLPGAARRRRTASSIRRGRVLYTGRTTSGRASRSSCTTASWSTGPCSATAPTSGPTTRPTTCAARRTSCARAYGGDSVRQRVTPDDRRLPHEPLRRGQRDADPHRAPGRGAPPARGPLLAVLLRAHDEERPAQEGDHRPPRARASSRPSSAGRRGRRRHRRPGHNYSYTNNWPPEPRVDNRPTANVIVWSVLSLIALLGGIGLLFGAFGRWALPGLARPRAGDAVLPRRRATWRSRRRSARPRGSSS